jgi:hypothetical protein
MIQRTNTYVPASPTQLFLDPNRKSTEKLRKDNNHRPQSHAMRINAYAYSYETVSLSYESKDGDMVTFQWEQTRLQELNAEISAQKNQKHLSDKLVGEIIDEIKKLQQSVVSRLINTIDGKTEKVEQVKPDMELPEYWNAENTSQRIVDFALSFYEMFEGDKEEYASIITNAIEEGFNQAREMLGELPESVSSLVDSTYELVMEKLENWVNGRSGEESENVTA